MVVITEQGNDQKAICKADELNEVENVNAFYVPMWVTSKSEVDEHIKMLEVIKTKMSIE
jgi:hypothetical protein